MYPVLFQIGTFPIGTYGLLLTAGFFLALAWPSAWAARTGSPGSTSRTWPSPLLLAGVLGSKLLMVIVDLFNGVPFAGGVRPGLPAGGGAIHGGIIAATRPSSGG